MFHENFPNPSGSDPLKELVIETIKLLPGPLTTDFVSGFLAFINSYRVLQGRTHMEPAVCNEELSDYQVLQFAGLQSTGSPSKEEAKENLLKTVKEEEIEEPTLRALLKEQPQCTPSSSVTHKRKPNEKLQLTTLESLLAAPPKKLCNYEMEDRRLTEIERSSPEEPQSKKLALYTKFTCIVCKKQVGSRLRILHMHAHLDYHPAGCGHCDYKARHSTLVAHHIRTMHPGKELEVVDCSDPDVNAEAESLVRQSLRYTQFCEYTGTNVLIEPVVKEKYQNRIRQHTGIPTGLVRNSQISNLGTPEVAVQPLQTKPHKASSAFAIDSVVRRFLTSDNPL